MKNKKNNKNSFWIKNRLSDFFVKQAKLLNYRSRSWFKLNEIQNKFNIIKKNTNILDIGSSPGGWSLYASKILANSGKIFACDILDMKPINNVIFIKGDISNYIIYNMLLKVIGDNKINLIMSDILPNISGYSSIDGPKSIILAEISLKISLKILTKNGYFLLKLINSNETNIFLKKINFFFKNINIFKPKSSNKKSKEFYIVANKL